MKQKKNPLEFVKTTGEYVLGSLESMNLREYAFGNIGSINLESILKSERKQRRKNFGKPEMRKMHYDTLKDIDDFLFAASDYFCNFKTLFRRLSIQSLKENKSLSEQISSISQDLKEHFNFILRSGLYWFNDKDKSKKFYSYLEERKSLENLPGEIREYFRISETNSNKIRALIYLKQTELLNFPSFNSPQIIKFFDELYSSVRRDASAEKFLNKYANC